MRGKDGLDCSLVSNKLYIGVEFTIDVVWCGRVSGSVRNIRCEAVVLSVDGRGGCVGCEGL